MFKYLVFALLVISSFTFRSGYSQDTKAYSFINLDADARSSALAGSFISMQNDVNAIFYNPAGLSTLTNSQASVGFYKYLLDINSGNASYSQKYKDIGFIGAGIKYMNYGSFKKYDEQFNEVGTFGATDLAFYAGYSNFITPNLTWGSNLKLIYSSIDEYTSTAIAADFGLLYMLPEKTFNAGISIQNLGFQISKYNTTSEDLPLNVRIGASKRLEYLPLTVNVAFNDLAEDTDDFIKRFKNFSIGGELNLSDNLNLRLGYDNQIRQDIKTGSSLGLTGFSAGFGFNMNNYRLDYAFNSLGSIGATHRINLGFELK